MFQDNIADLILEGDFDRLILTSNEFILVGNNFTTFKLWEDMDGNFHKQQIAGKIEKWDLHYNEIKEFIEAQTGVTNIAKIHSWQWDIIYFLTDDGKIGRYRELNKKNDFFKLRQSQVYYECETTYDNLIQLEETICYQASEIALKNNQFRDVYFIGKRIYEKQISIFPPEIEQLTTSGLYVINKYC